MPPLDASPQIDFVQLVEAWFRGDDIRTRVFWGMQVFWWARIGSLVQLLSAFVVVLELVGTDRIRAFGSKLEPLLGIERARRRLYRGRRWLALQRKFIRATTDAEEDRALDRAEAFGINWIHYLVWISVTAAFVYIAWPVWWLLLIALAGSAFAFLWVVPQLTFFIAVLVSFVGIMLNRSMLAPLGRWFASPKLHSAVTILSLIFLVLGTALSLLGS